MQKRSVPRRPPTRRRGAATTVDDYIAAVPKPALDPLRRLRATVRSVVPRDAREVISYRIPAFKRDRVLVWYAAFAHHVSLFPGGSVLARFEDDLREYKTSRGTVQFPLDKPLPIPLIKRIVKARVLEVEGKRSRRRVHAVMRTAGRPQMDHKSPAQPGPAAADRPSAGPGGAPGD